MWYLCLKGGTETGFSPITSDFSSVGITPLILPTHPPPTLRYRINWLHRYTKH
jgi:hypothetical protein